MLVENYSNSRSRQTHRLSRQFLVAARPNHVPTHVKSPEAAKGAVRDRTRAVRKKGCAERIAPRCTLSQNGYGEDLPFEVGWAQTCSWGAGAEHNVQTI